MAILEIRNFPDPILRQVSKEVDYVSDEIRKLMDDMMETMYSNNGVGLAAVHIKENFSNGYLVGFKKI